MSGLAAYADAMRHVAPMHVEGTVAALRGLTLLVDDLPLPVGSLVAIGAGGSRDPLGEVVGFDAGRAIVMMLGRSTGLRAGDRVWNMSTGATIPVGGGLLGRIINGLGQPIDGKGPVVGLVPRPLYVEPMPPLRRRRIAQALPTGVRALDLMVTLGRGQRVGIFSGPGVGKSTLLGCVARYCDAEVVVVALIGERGREVNDFLARSLGPEGLARSVVVVATSDESPPMRIRAALTACTVAEYFRDQGRDVLLLMDSITRVAHAARQVGLAVGEPPATRGYTPSVFALLPAILERAGTADQGSITGVYTILVEGDDLTEPVADAVRGILDGHVILSRRLAQAAHYPAIDVLDSVSRVAEDVCDPAHVAARRLVLRLLAAYHSVEDLVQIGAYTPGSHPEADVALEFRPRILELLRQGRDERAPFDQARQALVHLALEAGESLRRQSTRSSTTPPARAPTSGR